VHAAVLVAARHFLVEDAAASGHPLDVAGAECSTIPEAVAVRDVARQHVGDRLDAPMRVPGKAGEVVRGVVVAKIVEQQERIEVGRIAESERALQPDAGAFERGFRRTDVSDRANGHRSMLLPVSILYIVDILNSHLILSSSSTQLAPVRTILIESLLL
jgi:hypothetical protein